MLACERSTHVRRNDPPSGQSECHKNHHLPLLPLTPLAHLVFLPAISAQTLCKNTPQPQENAFLLDEWLLKSCQWKKSTSSAWLSFLRLFLCEGANGKNPQTLTKYDKHHAHHHHHRASSCSFATRGGWWASKNRKKGTKDFPHHRGGATRPGDDSSLKVLAHLLWRVGDGTQSAFWMQNPAVDNGTICTPTEPEIP